MPPESLDEKEIAVDELPEGLAVFVTFTPAALEDIKERAAQKVADAVLLRMKELK